MPTHFSASERQLAKLLRHFPLVKRISKRVYQYISWLVNKRSDKAISSLPVTPIVANPDNDSFFGYYDKCPENVTGTHIIFHEHAGPSRRRPDPATPVEIVVVEKTSNTVEARLSSRAYNWQQGSRLQWLSQTRFVFNDYDENAGEYVARQYDIETQKLLPPLAMPIYDCFADEFALTLNFDRLDRLAPDYGYASKRKRADNLLRSDDDDGIFRLDLRTGKSSLLVSLDELASFSPQKSMQDASHSVNHIMISPDGAHAIAIHRWYRNGRRFDRLIALDCVKGKFTSLADSEMVSHCFWLNESIILGYLRGADGTDRYWLIDVASAEATPLPSASLDQYGDGHPHVSGDWFVTDTYPDKARMQHLLRCNWKTGEVRKLGEFFHGFAFDGETRCDLHPRISMDGCRVFFDSVFTGRRRLYCLDICPDSTPSE